MLKKIFISILILAILSGCSISDTSQNTEIKSQKKILKVGLMPAVDSAPFLLADKNGYFNDLGLQVEYEIYTNAQNRQSALQTHSIDGAMTDLVAATVNVEGGFNIKATMMTNGIFPILYKSGSDTKKTIKVGMMEISVSNYLIDELLTQKYNIEKIFINEIPARLTALEIGQIDMGIFPEPFASIGVVKGLERKVYTTKTDFCPDVIVFTQKALHEKKDAISLFHMGYDKAIEDINRNPNIAKDILIEKIPNIKPELKDFIILPKYTKATLQDNEYIQNIIDWTKVVVKKDISIKPTDIVTREFVEK